MTLTLANYFKGLNFRSHLQYRSRMLAFSVPGLGLVPKSMWETGKWNGLSKDLTHTPDFTVWILSVFITNESRRNHKEQGDLDLSVTLIKSQTLSHTKASGTLYLVPGALETPVKSEVCSTNKISSECPEGSEHQHVIHYKSTQIH